MMGGGDPMMGDEDPMMGGGDPMMGGEDPMMGDEDPQSQNQMQDDGFDAGVDADEDEDPKKYIQQLTGKLSQTLMSYNDEQGTPDTDLNKYVAGMIIPQATKDMTDREKKDVINKINNGNTDDEEMPSDDDMSDNDKMSQDDDMPMESTNRRNMSNIVNEIINSYLDDKKRKEKKITNNKISKSNPFISNM